MALFRWIQRKADQHYTVLTVHYSRLAQNEMALGFFRSGLFDPRLADQAAACVDMMDFDGKGTVQEGIVKRGKIYAQTAAAKEVVQ